MASSSDNSSRGFASSSMQSSTNKPGTLNTPGAGQTVSSGVQLPTINLPKGGGAIRNIEEKFQVNAVTGTSSFSIPLPFSAGRGGAPAIGLSYNSGAGNSPFGLGWQLGVPSIARKTEKRLPQYFDEQDSDTFIIAGSEDLVPFLEKPGADWIKYIRTRTVNGITYTIKRYRPRIESAFTRIECWKNNLTGEVHWKTISAGNIHSYFGITAASRIEDPADTSRVFEWMLSYSHDDKGNISLFEYKKEDYTGIPASQFEKNKTGHCTQLYLKKILYGNKLPWYLNDALPVETDFLFKSIFDYGEHSTAVAIPQNIDQAINTWTCRKDPFSSFRAGFEIRTYRRCRRVLMFHCFSPAELPISPYLTTSLELFYNEDLDFTSSGKKETGFSYLVKARQNGHKWDAGLNAYTTKSLPETEITYQAHEWNTAVERMSDDSSVHAPAGLRDKNYLWIDLFSEGIAGMLTEQGDNWFYKSNLGNGEFSRAMTPLAKPSFTGLASETIFIEELGGDSSKYMVQLDNEPKGFFKLDDEQDWQPMKNFSSVLNIKARNSNARTIDLTGNGKGDLLITEDNTLRWYEGLGEDGFAVSKQVAKEIDEEKGPAVIFADLSQSIFLSDMNGDGLTDIVRIRNGEICYWPNCGFGVFGRKVGMSNAPVFDSPEMFNPAFLRLADIDGSGTTDIVYLGKNDFRVWMNQSGNEWGSEPHVITAFPPVHDMADVAVLDFLGHGTACIVYSTALGQQPVWYIDIMGSRKPHLLTGYKNNCGREFTIEYKSSTHFYLEDKKEGRPWITKLPFPVHCIANTRSEDKIRKTVFTSSYRYSHGYYDHDEREFRGFGKIEQLDTEDFSHFKLNNAKNVVEEELHQPPVRSVSWFHTGAFLRNKKILHQYEQEYFQNELFTEYSMPEIILPAGLTDEELREACRACKGALLRAEVYADDKLPQSIYPFSATQTNKEIRLVQPKGPNKHASFQVLSSESVAYSYERNPADPRMAHSFVLEMDDLGLPLKTVSVVYKRVSRPVGAAAIPDKVWEEQSKTHIVHGEATYTKDIIEDDVYRLRTGYDTKTWELGGVDIAAGTFFSKSAIKLSIDTAAPLLFEEEFTGAVEKRLTAHNCGYFMKDDLSGPLKLGELSKLGIGYKSYSLAFTKNLVTKYYGTKVTDAMLKDAKYVHLEGDEHWWTQPGEAIFPANAKDKFYIPVGTRDVFGNESYIEFDTLFLTVKKMTDAIGNSVTAVCDYRTLSPVMVTDANMNRTAVETDELGMVIKSAVMGKDGAGEGDTLANPTARIEYDAFNWKNNGKPNYTHTFTREKHGDPMTRWQESYTYSDGGGSVIMIKVQAEPGKAKKWNPVTKLVDEIDADPRWVGNGRTIFNNKGNPVKSFEPFFSTTHDYESEDALVESGFSSIIYYDAAGRTIRTELPNGTFSKIVFDAWYSKVYDTNDTVKNSQWYIDRGSPNPVGAEPADPEQRAAWLAAKHHDTPGTVHTDSLGRKFYATSDYGAGKTVSGWTESDAAGRYSRSYDQKQRLVSEGYSNMTGAGMYSKTAEKGEKWIFSDVMGRLVKIWDNADSEMWMKFDTLHRPVSTFVKEGMTETLFSHIFYGDALPDAVQKNLKGTAYKTFDQAGEITTGSVDFKGNTLSAERRLTKEYKQIINWNVLDGLTTLADVNNAADPLLEKEIFASSAELDALNRPVTVTMPDKTVIKPVYGIANLLKTMQAQVGGKGAFINFLEGQEYDAKGQRQYAKYGNGLITNYFYDPKTFRLVNLITKKNGDPDTNSLQNLFYTFDTAGNIVYTKDDAQETHYFKNAVIKAESKFVYDALYQLKTATGRELAGLGNADSQRSNSDLDFVNHLPHINNADAVRNYREEYEYDDLGNFKQLKHIASGASWTQEYHYEYDDDASNKTNLLKSTSLPGDPPGGPYTALYTHDARGNMTAMPHLSAADSLVWNYADQLKEVNLGGGGTAYYVYGVGSNRVRKIIERPGGKKTERIYLGVVEIYREYQAGSKRFERNTLHISDNTGRIAQVDTKLLDLDGTDVINPLNTDLVRYQFNNHLGSAMMETDKDGVVITYEEYHPYGTSSYRSTKSGADLSLKRYRFSGKERDDETGFYYFGARYYAAWLGRWTSSDPAGFVKGYNLYRYCSNSPIMFFDPNGMDEKTPDNVVPVWTMDNSKASKDELAKINDPQANATDVLKIFQKYGYTGKGPLKWVETPGFTGWWDTSIKVSTTEESNIAGGPGGEGGDSKTPGGNGNGKDGGNGTSKTDGGNGNDPSGTPAIPPPSWPVTGANPSQLPTTPIPKIDLPQAPPGTDFKAAEAAGRANLRNLVPHGPGEQAQHWLKWRNGRDTNLDPRITNDPRYMSPLQSQNALSGNFNKPVPDGGRFNNPHKYSDRFLYMENERDARDQYGSVATERVVQVEAGRRTMQQMTGNKGPTPPYIYWPTVMGVAGNVTLGVTRTVVPGVAEGEFILLGASQTATYYGYFGVATALETGAAYVPIIGGSAFAGAIVGNVVDNAVTQATGSSGWGTAAGVGAAAVSGAAVGALIGSVVPVAGTVVGAGVGAAVGAVAGLGAYLITKFW